MSSLMAEAPAEAHATRRFLRVVRCPALLPSPAVTPLVVIAAGLAAIAVGTLLLRTYGPARPRRPPPRRDAVGRRSRRRAGWRSPASAATSGSIGRLDADEEFADENERPLVFRRRRLETRRGRGWHLLDERLESVPFRVGEGLDEIDVDADALDVGLVTLVRESVGTAAEAGEALEPDVRAGLAPSARRCDCGSSSSRPWSMPRSSACRWRRPTGAWR